MHTLIEFAQQHPYGAFSIVLVLALAATIVHYELARANDELHNRWVYDRSTRVMSENLELKQQLRGAEQVMDELAAEKRSLVDHSLSVLEENEQLSQVLSLYIGKALHDIMGEPMHQPIEDEQPALPFDMPFNVEDRRGN